MLFWADWPFRHIPQWDKLANNCELGISCLGLREGPWAWKFEEEQRSVGADDRKDGHCEFWSDPKSSLAKPSRTSQYCSKSNRRPSWRRGCSCWSGGILSKWYCNYHYGTDNTIRPCWRYCYSIKFPQLVLLAKIEGKYIGSVFHKYEQMVVRFTWYFGSSVFYGAQTEIINWIFSILF